MELDEKRTVVYMWSPEYESVCSSFERCSGRAEVVHGLLRGYGLFERLALVRPQPASFDALAEFHDRAYLRLLQAEEESEEAEEAGLDWDCPVRPGLWRYVTLSAGATLVAVDALLAGHAKVGVNWGGGWHHAGVDRAAGYCYANDAVLAILRLRRRFRKMGELKVLYVDVDIHHGDGVADAFAASPNVLCLSLHHRSAGFFPGTGAATEVGLGRGRHATLNVPLHEGLTDQDFTHVFDQVMDVVESWGAEAVVGQLGADGLSRDPAGAWNLTELSYLSALDRLVRLDVPLLVLGGGGYDGANTARLWTQLTNRLVSSTPLPEDVPSASPAFLRLAPDYALPIPPGKIPNRNSPASLDAAVRSVRESMARLMEEE